MSDEKLPSDEKKSAPPATPAPKDESPSKDDGYTFRDWASI